MKKILVYWRDIPAQVIVQRGRRRAKVQLPGRFQAAIDRAAMRAGKGSSDAYLSEWRRETVKVDDADDLQDYAEAVASKLDNGIDDARLLTLIRNHGKRAGE